MKGKSRFLITLIIIFVLIVLMAIILSVIKFKNEDNIILKLQNAEDLRAMNYEKVTNETAKVENTENVTFTAFFTRDLDGDGNAEKLLGTCKSLKAKDILYMDLNVLTEGYLKNGLITIQSNNNFNYSMKMVKDVVLKENYISDNVKQIYLNDVHAGTQKLIFGNIIANIGKNINDYSEITAITLTGTHVSDDGIETEIEKTINVQVDWYGDVSASLSANNSTYYYDDLTSNIVKFSFNVNERSEELLLKEVIATATVPELNGYAPISVVCTNSNVIANYDNETRIITIKKNSVIKDNVVIASSLSRSNLYSINVSYPEEAFKNITSYTELIIPVTGQYIAYNNINNEFENPVSSNIAKGNVIIVFSETPPPTGYIYDFDIEFADKQFVLKPNARYVISKQELLNMYNNEDYIADFEYEVNWYAYKGNLGEVNSFIMGERKQTEENYGDKFDGLIIQEYTTNNAIYFTGTDNALGLAGKISVYNNDTNELLKEFTSYDWNKYTNLTPYIYSEEVKHIRVETTAPKNNTVFVVHNIKKLDTNKILQDFTKEQIKNVNFIYSYLTGIANIEGQGEESVNDVDSAYLTEEISYAGISISNNKIATQETTNEKIYISTHETQIGDAKWKNGEFIVEVPQEIINMEISSITINNSKVKIFAYELYKENGKYLIKIVTENEEPTNYRITIDCEITPDARIATTDNSFKLYAYNEECDEYYYSATDIYDVDSDNNIEEQIAISSTNLELLSPTSLITLETISNYNEEQEITIAPNVADVEKENRKATININLTNNYPNTISGVKVLGKIPFKGNSFIINGKDLKSEYSTTMTNAGIKADESNPSGVNEKVVVYYSENENPTKDLADSSNGWKLYENVEDFSKIKTFLIDLQDNEISIKNTINFSYDVILPENVSYNESSYSTHAIYYELNIEGGNLFLSTEPNKVGIRIVDEFNFELIKYKINSNVVIPGVIYFLTYKEKDLEGVLQDKKRILTTNENGVVILEDLKAEIEYTLQEIKVPNTCELNTNTVKFKVNKDLTVMVDGETKNYEFTADEIFKIGLEDEIKYNIEINKTKIGGSVPINGVRFLLEDTDGSEKIVRTVNGKAVFEGLSLNKQYTLTESFVPVNCEKNEGKFIFKLVRNNETNEIIVQTILNTLISGSPMVRDSADVLTPVLEANVQNEIRYSLNLKKQDIQGNALQGIEFTIKGSGFSEQGTTYISSREGNISIVGLLVGETYVIEETSANGYYLDNTKDNTIQFKLERINGDLQITTWNKGSGIMQVGNATVSGQEFIETVSAVLQNEKIPTYNLKIKKQNKDGEILSGAQFKLTSLDTGYEQEIRIDENGEGIFTGLYEFVDGKNITGEYALQEISAPEGYLIPTSTMKFICSKDKDGNFKINIIEGEDLLKINDETNEIETNIAGNEVELNIINEPIFKLEKYGDLDVLLPNAKFTITDLEGNPAKDIKGNIVGEEIVINGNKMYTVSTDENGTINVELEKGIYKAIEVVAPENYALPENIEDRTHYFGIGESGSLTSGKIDKVEWAKSIKSDKVSEFNDAVETLDGGILAVGRTNEKIDINGDGVEDCTAQGKLDAIIVKYDVNGDIKWSKVLGGKGNDEILAITKDPTGGYVIVGYTSTSYVKYDGNLIDVANYGYEDGIIIKIDESGNYLWNQCIGGTGADRINGVAVAEDGKVAVVGGYYSSTCYLDKNQTVSLTNTVNTYINEFIDGFISVYTNSGEYIWSQNMGGPSTDSYGRYEQWAEDVVATSSGFTVVANINSIIIDGKTIMVNNDTINAIIINYSYSGNCTWYKLIRCSNSTILNDIMVVKTDNNEEKIITSGCYAASMPEYNLSCAGRFDSMILEFNATNGNYIRSFSIGGNYDDTINSIYETKDGGLLMGGLFYSSTVDIGKDGTKDITSNKGNCDGVIVKLDKDYNVEFYDTINGTGFDEVTAVIESSVNNFDVFAVGKYDSSSLTCMNISNVLSNTRFTDAFIVKYCESVTVNIPEVQNIRIDNNLIKHNITTEIKPNSLGNRDGGTIIGVYNDKYLAGNNIKFVESVSHGYTGVNDIVITPNNDYVVECIMVNNVEITDYSFNEDGSVVIPAEFFDEITEDKHIAVVFEKKDNLIINKVDEVDNSVKLAGAKFKVEQKIDPNLLLGGICSGYGSNISYYFSQVGANTYQSTNTNVSNSVCASFFPINLTDYSGRTFTLNINASISSESVNYDYGYARITTSSTTPTYTDETGQIFKIGGTSVPTQTYSTTLQGGQMYFLHIGYRKDGSVNSGTDKFTINSINLTTDDTNILMGEVETNSQGMASLRVENNIEYTITEIQAPNGYKLNTVPQKVTVAPGEIKNITITNKKIEKDANLKITKVDSEDNSIKLEGAEFEISQKPQDTAGVLGTLTNNGTYVFNENNGIFTPNNKGVHNSTAKSYIKIDLTGKIGKYKLIVNAQVSSESNWDFGFAAVTQNSTAPSFNKNSEVTGQFIGISGTSNTPAEYIYTDLQGGNIYYLHLAYLKDGSGNTGNDLFTVNSVRIEEAIDSIKVTTNKEGIAEISLNPEEYIINETKAPEGYSLNEESQIIVVVNGNNEITITNTAKKFNIITKIERTPTQQVDGGTISGKDEQPYEEVSYKHTSTKDILIDPDDGYQITSIKINGEQIEFTPDENGNVLLDKFTDMQENKEVIVKFEPIYESNFTLKKTDEVTNEPLEGIQFAVYYLSVGNDFAKDKNGRYIGELNENGIYVVTTDANGEVKLSLPTGLYKAVEVKGANGYVLPEKEEDRTIYFRVVAPADVEINYIEDLIDFSNDVANGNTYEGKVVSLARDLDFNDVNSYRNANDMTTYGDYNGDSLVESVKEELTNISGCGFKPIGGDLDHGFSGIFDGNCFEIKNIYINTQYAALFTNVLNAEILNLKLTDANIINSGCGAGFAYNARYSKIYNCSIDGVLRSTGNAPTGGIVYITNNCEIINCYNNADISGVCTGGISSSINNSLIENCYNTGDLISTGPTGGIAYNIDKSIIKNSYNTGSVTGRGCSGGLSAYIYNSTIENYYNTGKIYDSSAPAGGLAQYVSNCNIKNFYNTGDVFGNAGTGGLAQSIGGSNLEKCYNTGNISSYNSGASGLGLYISGSTLKECYNTGNVLSTNYVAGGFASSISGSTVEECYNTGNVISDYSTSGDTNGAAGFAITFSNSNVKKCFNEGTISSKYRGAGFALKADDSNFEKCYNKGEVNAIDSISGFINIANSCNLINVYNKGNVNGAGGSAGGISVNITGTYLEKCANMGNVYAGPGTGGVVYNASDSTIVKCYNTGIVKAGGTAGGLCYYVSNSLAQDCYNTGEVYSGAPAGGLAYGLNSATMNNCYNLGNVSGSYGVGGIAEYNNNSSIINNCYNAGKLLKSDYMSGIVYSYGSLQARNTYYLNTTAPYGLGTTADTTGVTEAKTLMQMSSRAFATTLNKNKDAIKTSNPLSNWKYNLAGLPVLDFEIDMYEYDTGSKENDNKNEDISIDGIINSDVQIMYIEDLIDLSKNVANGNTYEGKVVSLVRTLDFKNPNSYRNADDTTTYGDYNGDGMIQTIKDELINTYMNGFKPIGETTDKAFSGVFNGNGFEIKNLYIKTSYAALFTNVVDGEILNLKLTNANITNSGCGAGFAYYATNSKINNCGIDGIVKSSSNATTAGFVYTANNCEIKDCYNNADIRGVCTAGISSYAYDSIIENCYNTGEINGRGCSGGVVGYGTNLNMENCYNTGNVIDAFAPAGGLIYSVSSCNITNSYNTGDVSGYSGAGGIAQNISNSTLEKCYNEGYINSLNSSAAGIAMYITDSSFKECYNKGDVNSDYNTSGNNNGAGGFAITFTNSTAEKCFNEGKIVSKLDSAGLALRAEGSTIEQCYNKGEVQANNYTAGLVYVSVDSNYKNSYNKGTVIGNSPNAGLITVLTNGTIEQCANFGVVKANAPAAGVVYTASGANIIKCYNSGEVYGPSTVGGVVYGATDSLIQDCYNEGKVNCTVPIGGVVYGLTNSTVNNCYNIGKVMGNYNVGGVAEYMDSNSKINNCYNAGELVSGANSTGKPIGGIVYSASIDNLNNTYYLNTTAESGIYDIADVAGKTEAKTAEEMTSQEFVEKLNTNKNSIETNILLSNWKFNENGYPVLDYQLNLYECDTEQVVQKPIVIPNYEKVDSELTVTNSKAAKVIVHHYLEGTGPEFENEPVVLAEDEIINGKENYEYITSPNLNIEEYTLIQDENGEYIIPENASGKFTVEDQHIYYYYNIKPLELVVHHYLEGTEDKLAEDEKYLYKENEHYKVAPSEEVLKAYDLVLVEGDEEKDITQDEVVTYYYKKKEYKITTKVVIPEAEVEAGRTENGGTILGEELEIYEVVKYGENSKNDIIATPDEGYKLSSITVNGKVVPFTIKDGKVQIEKFENMTEDKEVVVVFKPTVGKVITHHYIQGTTEKLYEDIINIDKIGALVNTNPVEVDGYKLVASAGNKDEDGNVVIIKDESQGVEEIIYYYQKAYIITTDVIEHDEKYKDGTVKTGVKGGSITNEDVVIHEQVIRYEDSVKVIAMLPDSEYEVVEVRINGQVEDLTKFELDENGNLVIPEGYFTNVQKDIHVEVQYRRNSKVIVKYLEEGTEKELAEEENILGYEGKEFETAGKIIPGYTLVMEVVSNGSQGDNQGGSEGGNQDGSEDGSENGSQDGSEDGSQDGTQNGNDDENQEKTIKITDENYNPTQPNGTMFTDDITVIYWYEKIDANVIERHIEIDARGEEKEIEFIIHNDDTAATVETLRKEYEGYASVNVPEETKQKVENEFTNITFAQDNQTKVIVTVDNTNVKEVWYYYIKQYNITTEVKPHKQSINGVETEVEGGTISKKFKIDENGKEVEDIYEVVDNRADSAKEIKMVPDDGYRIKSVTINDEEIYIDNLVAEDGSLLLPVAYFKDVQQSYHVVVEYERIPAKVIVQYIDEFTKESILPDKVIDGFVNDEYNEPRVEIDSYIAVGTEPENSQGKMVDGVITIVYYYGKQYKITTDVTEHLEDEEKSIVDVIVDKIDDAMDKVNGSEDVGSNSGNGSIDLENAGVKPGNGATGSENGATNSENTNNPSEGGSIIVVPEGKKLVKGGSIQGENEQPYEAVLRGANNIKEILIKPDDGYRIKLLKIKDGETELVLSVPDMLTKENTIILPKEYFKNIQSDKHIMVEFEQIPAKVVVNYLDIDSKDAENLGKVSTSEEGKGFVNDEYKTYAKDIPYYELVKEELPSNVQGKLTEKDTIVNYWYRKLLFNMKLTKEFSSILVNGEERLQEDKKFAKIDIANTEVENTNILVKYKITVTNTEKVEGVAKIVESIPVGFKYVANPEVVENVEKVSTETETEQATETVEVVEETAVQQTVETLQWQEVDGKLELTTKTLKPGETVEYEITLQWDKNQNCIGNLINTATITETQNIPQYEETTKEDNKDSCTLILAVRTRENRDIKTIVSISCFVLAGICTAVYVGMEVYARRKENE